MPGLEPAGLLNVGGGLEYGTFFGSTLGLGYLKPKLLQNLKRTLLASSIGRQSLVRWNGEVTLMRRMSSKPFLS